MKKVYVIYLADEKNSEEASKLIRENLKGFDIREDFYFDASFKERMKKAYEFSESTLLVEDEAFYNGEVILKDQFSGEQISVEFESLTGVL